VAASVDQDEAVFRFQCRNGAWLVPNLDAIGAYRLLSRRPNEWMTSFEFGQVMMFHAVLLGNGCA